jgi:hypothetical protein
MERRYLKDAFDKAKLKAVHHRDNHRKGEYAGAYPKHGKHR